MWEVIAFICLFFIIVNWKYLWVLDVSGTKLHLKTTPYGSDKLMDIFHYILEAKQLIDKTNLQINT